MPHAAPDTVEIRVSGESIGDIDPLESVGSIYEIGINGVGYMLSDDPEDPDTLPGVVVPNLEAPRLATTDTPFSQAVERYTFETFHDWSSGAGQRWLNRETSTSRSFFDSEGVDPFTIPGELSLLPSVSQSLAEVHFALKISVVGDDMYAQTANNILKRLNGPTETWGGGFTVTDPGAIVISGLTSDGQYWYAATGQSIVRGTTTNPAAAWSTEDAVSVQWSAGRICAAVKVGGSTPNRFTTLSEAGVEEVVGGHLELDEGHTIVLGGTAGGHFFFGSHVGDQGQIWAWQLGVDSEGAFHVPYVAWDMPQGLIPTAVHGAGGEVWIRAYRAEGASAGEVNIYRGVPGAGLTPFLVAELGVVDKEGAFDEIGDLIVFSWEDTSGKAALGAVSLVSGGYARWVLGKEPGLIRSVVEWQGREAFTIAGKGVYIRDIAGFETTGWLDTSIVDGASLLDKVLDSLTLDVSPVLAGGSVEVLYSLDAGSTFTTAGTLSTAGSQRAQFNLSLRTPTFSLRFVLGSAGTTTTRTFAVQAQFHPLGLKDLITVVRVKAYDTMTGVNGAPLPDNAKGRGVTIMRTLESFGQSRILLQDIDWHITGNATVVEVVAVRSTRIGIYDTQLGERRIGGDVELTFRKANT